LCKHPCRVTGYHSLASRPQPALHSFATSLHSSSSKHSKSPQQKVQLHPGLSSPSSSPAAAAAASRRDTTDSMLGRDRGSPDQQSCRDTHGSSSSIGGVLELIKLADRCCKHAPGQV
jgi:hypothetical protein